MSGAHQGGHREDSRGGEDKFDDDRVAVKGVHEPGPRTSGGPTPDEGDLPVEAQEEIVGEENCKCVEQRSEKQASLGEARRVLSHSHQ